MFLYVCVSLKYPTTKPTSVVKICFCNLLRAKCCLFLRSQAVMNAVWSGSRRQLTVWVTARDYTQWESNWSWINNNCAGIPSLSVSEEAVHSSVGTVKHLTPVDRVGKYLQSFKPSITKFHQQSSFGQTFDCFWSELLSVDGAKKRLHQAVGCVISIQYAHPPRALPSLSLIDGPWI